MKTLITIKRIPHTAATKQELFGLIGEFCASTKVREALGGPISSDENHIWFVAVSPSDEVIGFVAVVPQKGGKAKMVHLYIAIEGKWSAGIQKRLVEACEQEAKDMQDVELHTVDYSAREAWYKIYGWQASGHRGRFATYSKRLDG